MKKSWAVLAALVGLFTVLGVAPVQAYPDTTPTIHLSVSNKVLVGGKAFTAKATADTTCVWTLTYRKQRATGSGTSITHRFSTPVVKKRTQTTVRVTCAYNASGTDRSAAVSQPSTVSRTATVTLLPRKHNGNGNGHGHGNGNGGGHGNGNGHGGKHHGQAGAPGNPNTGGQSQGAGAGAGSGNGLLPDTGGFAWWWLLIAALLVGGGAAATARGRNRRADR